MSRLFGLLCDEPVNLSCKQVLKLPTGINEEDAVADMPPEADGWGIGFYRNKGSFLFKKASRNTRVQRIANIAEVVSSRIFISHLRKATVGDRKEANTHPFRWGNWLFAHLGTVSHFRKIRSRILRTLPPAYKKLIHGNTDSEHLFYLYLSMLRGEGGIKKGQISLSAAVDGLKNFGKILEEFRRDAEIQETSVLNFLISNGTYLLALRCEHPLYYISFEEGTTEETRFFSPVTRLEYEIVQYSPSNKMVVVASEKLTASTNWRQVPEKHILAVDCKQEINLTPWL